MCNQDDKLDEAITRLRMAANLTQDNQVFGYVAIVHLAIYDCILMTGNSDSNTESHRKTE